jgi:hypothetical protein
MKTLYTILGLFILGIPAFTQTSLEISAGPAFSNVSVRGVSDAFNPDRTLHTGLQAQVLASQNIGSNLEFMTGLAYKEKGFHINESIHMDVMNIPARIGVEAITTFRYLEVPLNLKYNIASGPVDIFAFGRTDHRLYDEWRCPDQSQLNH